MSSVQHLHQVSALFDFFDPFDSSDSFDLFFSFLNVRIFFLFHPVTFAAFFIHFIWLSFSTFCPLKGPSKPIIYKAGVIAAAVVSSLIVAGTVLILFYIR